MGSDCRPRWREWEGGFFTPRTTSRSSRGSAHRGGAAAERGHRRLAHHPGRRNRLGKRSRGPWNPRAEWTRSTVRRGQLRRLARRPGRKRAFRLSAGRIYRRGPGQPGAAPRRREGEPCCSTRWRISIWPCRPSCWACLNRARSCHWVRRGRFASTRDSWLLDSNPCVAMWTRDGFAPTCWDAWTASPCACPPCVNVEPISFPCFPTSCDHWAAAGESTLQGPHLPERIGEQALSAAPPASPQADNRSSVIPSTRGQVLENSLISVGVAVRLVLWCASSR
jgi:hypothetical protein